MQQIYQLKQYRAGSCIKTINPDTIDSDISFTASKNGGQGELRLNVIENFDSMNYNLGDIIKVYIFNEYVSGYLLYTGYIESINKRSTNSESIELGILGIASLLKTLFYRHSSVHEFNKNDTPINILTEIITNFATDSGLPFTIGDVVVTPTNIDIDIDHVTCFDAIKLVMGYIDYYWYVDQNYKLHIRPYEIKHSLTYGKEISNLDLKQDMNIYNRIHLRYNGTSHISYDDTISQGLYGIREKLVTSNEIKTLATANEYAAQRLIDNAYPNNDTRIVVTDQYKRNQPIVRDDSKYRDDSEYWIEIGPTGSTETIEPGDGVRIQNFYTEVTGGVDKVSYNNGFVSLTLDKSYNLIQLIKA